LIRLYCVSSKKKATVFWWISKEKTERIREKRIKIRVWKEQVCKKSADENASYSEDNSRKNSSLDSKLNFWLDSRISIAKSCDQQIQNFSSI
jgi:DNA-binding PucR family transcriptional regulator